MILTNNQILTPKSPVPQHPDSTRVAVPGVGFIYIANASAQTITDISVDTVAALKPDSFLLGGSPGTAPQWVEVPRISAPDGLFFGPNSNLTVTFVGSQSWSQYIHLSPFAPSASLWLWCFYNGFILSDPYGNMAQLSWE